MEMSLEVGEGKSESVPFKLERDPGFAEPDDETGDEQAPAPAPEGDPGGGTLLPAAVAWGVSAVGFGVGTLFGVFAFDEADKARSNCVENLCTEEAREALEASKLNGGLSTAGFVVGGAGLVTGIVLAVVYGSGDAPAPAAQRGAVRMSPWVGGDQIGVTGAF